MTEAQAAKTENVWLHRLEVQTRVWLNLAGVASGAALAAFLCYFIFEQITDHAYAMMQPAVYVPALGPRSTEWLLITIFSIIFVAASYAASIFLPAATLARRFISNGVTLYAMYFGIVLTGIYFSIPDHLLKKDLFLRLLIPAILAPEDFLLFVLVPLAPIYFQYRKRQIALWSRADLVRIIIAVLLWATILSALLQVP